MVTYRPDEITAVPLLRRLSSRLQAVGGMRITLRPLDASATASLVSSMLGDLIRHAGQWERRSLRELAVPPTVRDSVLERVQPLIPAARGIVQAAAVLTDPASGQSLIKVAGLAAGQAEPGLIAALGSGILHADERGLVCFRHALACQGPGRLGEPQDVPLYRAFAAPQPPHPGGRRTDRPGIIGATLPQQRSIYRLSRLGVPRLG